MQAVKKNYSQKKNYAIFAPANEFISFSLLMVYKYMKKLFLILGIFCLHFGFAQETQWEMKKYTANPQKSYTKYKEVKVDSLYQMIFASQVVVDMDGFVRKEITTTENGDVCQEFDEKRQDGKLVTTFKRSCKAKDGVKTLFLYDEKGRVKEELIYDNIKVESFDVIYEYKGEGKNPIAKRKYQNTTYPVMEYEYKYDTRGTVIEERHITKNSKVIYKYNYDSHHILQEKTMEIGDKTTKTKYIYDANGKLVGEVVTLPNNQKENYLYQYE